MDKNPGLPGRKRSWIMADTMHANVTTASSRTVHPSPAKNRRMTSIRIASGTDLELASSRRSQLWCHISASKIMAFCNTQRRRCAKFACEFACADEFAGEFDVVMMYCSMA